MRRSVISAAAAADVPEEEPVVEVEAEEVAEEAAPADGQEAVAVLRNIRGSPDKVIDTQRAQGLLHSPFRTKHTQTSDSWRPLGNIP